MKQIYGVNRVFLATDTPKVLEALRNLDRSFEWTSLENFVLGREQLSQVCWQV